MRYFLIVVVVLALGYAADNYWYQGRYFDALSGIISRIVHHFQGPLRAWTIGPLAGGRAAAVRCPRAGGATGASACRGRRGRTARVKVGIGVQFQRNRILFLGPHMRRENGV